MIQQLKPIAEPFDTAIAEILSGYPNRDGYILNLFRVFANSSRFLRKGVLNLLDKDSPLSLRQRELVILRVTANLNCEYEWGVHVAEFAAAAGFSSDQIKATRHAEAGVGCWSGEESVLLQVVDEFCAMAKLEAATRHRFEQLWSLEQQLEVMALCGNYHTVCFVANSAQLPLEDFGARFPRDKE